MIERIRRPRRARLSAALAALALTLLLSTGARAGLVIKLQPASTTAAAGSSNNVLEVVLINDSSDSLTLSAFNVTLSVPAGAGVTFTGGDASTSLPYVFAGNSVGFLFVNPSGANTADVSDLADDTMQLIPGNSTLGLGRIFFSVDAVAVPDVYTVSIEPATSLTGGGPNFDPLPFTSEGAEITVTVAAVPEPSTLALSATAIALAGVAWLRRSAR